MRLRRALVAALALGLLAPAAANGSFHLMKVREVYPGDSVDPDARFIELQMYSGGQNFVKDHVVTAYSASGATEDYTFADDVANGQNQRTILLATAEAEAKFGLSADLVFDKGGPEPAGGAVCFETWDCVSWGSYSAGGLTGPAGASAPAIPDGSSLVRTIAPGCETLLEGSDDTNDSATDFFTSAQPTPRSNATPPTEMPCAASDRTIEAPSLAAKKKQSAKKGKVRATVGAAEDVTVKLTARGKAGGKKVKFKPKTVSPGAGQTATATLKAKGGKAKKAIKKAAKKGKKTKVTVKAKFTDGVGNSETLKTKVKLK